jgi:aspartyl protease family protein
MQKLFFAVIAFGALVGFLAPSGPDAEPPKVHAASSSDEDPEEPRETVLEREEDGHFYAHAEVNGELVRFLVDTGATGIALTREDAERVGIEVDPARFQIVGSGASGPVRGQMVELDTVSVDGKAAHELAGAVLDGLEISLLGQNYLGQYSMVVRGDTMRIE